MAKKHRRKNTVSNSKISAGGDVHIGDNSYSNSKDQKGKKASFDLKEINWDQIHQKISKGRIKKALDILISASKAIDADLYNEVIQQSERWSRLQEELRLNLITREEEERLINRVVRSLILVVDELKSMKS